MSLLTPAAFWLALTLPAILVLYLLKRRYQDQTVSSTYLWRQALRDLEASSPWQKLRRHLLLYLQLAAAALLVLAAVRPALLTRAPSGDVIVVLDASASMQATDVAPSRFEVARSRARALIEGLGRSDRLTLVTAAARPKVLAVASRDRAELLRALGAAQVTSETADLEEALKTALASLQGRSGQTPSVTAVVISDGGVAPGSRPNWPMDIRYERVGEDAGNLAVLAFSLAVPESSPSGAAAGATGGPAAQLPGLSGLVRVANYGPSPAEAVLDLLANGQVVATRDLSLAVGEEQDLTFTDLPLEPSYLARIQPAPGMQAPGGAAPADALAADNVAYAVSPSADRASALLVTSGNRFLERAMSLYPGLEVYRATPDEYATLTEPEAYALVVFDGYLPDRLPATNLWLLNPSRDNVLAVTASRAVAGLEAADPSDSLLRYVDLSGWTLARSHRLDPGTWARPLLVETQGPDAGGVLAAAGEKDGRRNVVWGFDIHDSDLPLRPAFPVLVQNTLAWLSPSDLVPQGSIRPGDLVPLTLPAGAAEARVVGPDGRSTQVRPGEPFAGADTPGIYRLVADGAETPGQVSFAVNLNTTVESDLKPAQTLPLAGAGTPAAPDDGVPEGSGGPGPVQAAAVGPLGRRELWPLLTLGALAILTLEWWVSTRGY